MTEPTPTPDYTALVREQLDDVYFPAGVELWLSAPNAAFSHKTPAATIAAGHGVEVLRYARLIGGGAY